METVFNDPQFAVLSVGAFNSFDIGHIVILFDVQDWTKLCWCKGFILGNLYNVDFRFCKNIAKLKGKQHYRA